ncbi:YihY/virulence factor BrkB family protein [Intrasporangium mesophilum]
MTAWVKASRPYEAWLRYAIANGNLLAAGVAYFAFFSLFPALALAFAVFGTILKDRPDVMQTLVQSVNDAFPGMVKTPETPNGVISIQAPSSLTLTITGVISFVTLLLAGLGWVGALRTGIRGLFGLKASSDNVVFRRVRDLFALVTLGAAILVSAFVTSAVGGWTGTVASWLGLSGTGPLVGVLGFVLGVTLDTAIMVILLRMFSRISLPWRNVRDGAVLGALAITLLKLIGGYLVSRVTSNPLLGAVAVSVGLLFWLNLISRIILLSAAWAAANVDVERFGEPGIGPSIERLGIPTTATAQDIATGGGGARPDAVAAPLPPAQSPPAELPHAGRAASRKTDLLSVAAGMVLGVTAMMGLNTIRKGFGGRRSPTVLRE